MTTSAEPEDAVAVRDAACLVLFADQPTAPRLLMGRRPADQIFLPNTWVFPGGRVDACDHDAHVDDVAAALPEVLRPFARAAIRELHEETGLTWRTTSNERDLRPLARAITPPGRVRRYDTWFFISRYHSPTTGRFTGDGELLDLAWFTIDEARALDLPHITRLVLDDAADALARPGARAAESVPFYRTGPNGFERVLTTCRPAATPP
ncbi:MAG: NUDIX hydrolase [Hyphomicrobium sp.]